MRLYPRKRKKPANWLTAAAQPFRERDKPIDLSAVVGYGLPSSAWACGWEIDVSTEGQITSLLGRWNAGDEEAFKSLVSLLYAELRRLAHNRLGQENSKLTVNTTALVHETYMRLADRMRSGTAIISLPLPLR